jgi:inner membrane protein
MHVNNKLIFVGMVLFATILPDLDSGFSTIGRKWYSKPLQLFVKHRGIIHSLTTAVVLSVLLAIFIPVTSLGFFIGYSVHIIADSFTKEGVQPFWPFKAKSKGFVRTGGKLEDSIFLTMIFINLILFLVVFVLG